MTSSPTLRNTLRIREKYILLLTVATFIVFCVGGFFFLPELKAGTQFAYKQIKDAGPDLLGLIPPVDQGNGQVYTAPSSNIEAPNVYPIRVTARAKMSDMARFANKIKEEMDSINKSQNAAVLPQPFQMNSNGQVDSGIHAHEHEVEAPGLEDKSADWLPAELPSGEPSDPQTKQRRDTVRGMMEHAWQNYVKYAWGENELRPVSKRGHSPGIFGKTKLGWCFT